MLRDLSLSMMAGTEQHSLYAGTKKATCNHIAGRFYSMNTREPDSARPHMLRVFFS